MRLPLDWGRTDYFFATRNSFPVLKIIPKLFAVTDSLTKPNLQGDGDGGERVRVTLTKIPWDPAVCFHGARQNLHTYDCL